MKQIANNPVRGLMPIILASLAGALSGTAGADDRTLPGSRYIGMVAEVSASEEEWFRANWQRLSAEEREAVRRKLRKDWRETPPEQRHKQREELVDRMVDRVRDKIPVPMPGYGQPGYGQPGWGMPGGGYGQGYETRQWDDQDSDGGRGRGRR